MKQIVFFLILNLTFSQVKILSWNIENFEDQNLMKVLHLLRIR
jgi:hypothetical protein